MGAPKGGAGATTEKALLLVPTDLTSLTGGTCRRASPAELTQQARQIQQHSQTAHLVFQVECTPI